MTNRFMYDNSQIKEISRRSQLYFTFVSVSKDGPTYTNHLNLLSKLSCVTNSMLKQFVITTKNGSAVFNTAFLTETSSTISSIVKETHHELRYGLDIDDPRNILGKFEKLYQGEKVFFDDEDLPICKEITEKLFIICCPNFMKPQSLNCSERGCKNGVSDESDRKSGVVMCGLTNFLQNLDFQTFTIITNKVKYKCNIYAVCMSDVIKKQIEKDSTKKHYFYDFDDDNNEFEPFGEIFNFKSVEITKSNMNLFKEIAEDLQITCLLKDIDKFINDSGKVSQTINDQQLIIDSIDDLFDWLYNIKEKSVNTVFNLILDSVWIETEENIQELIAFIIEVAKTDIVIQPYLIDLIIELNKKTDDLKQLQILMPFLITKLMNIMLPSENRYKFCNCSSSYNDDNCKNNLNLNSFIYKLYKKGFIQKEELASTFKDYKSWTNPRTLWFLLLLIDMDILNADLIMKIYTCNEYDSNEHQYAEFIKQYLPDKLELYEKMLDSNEPPDLITRSLRIDDVNTVQSILSKTNIDVKTLFIPFNPFDEILLDSKMNYLNYSAAFGSIKCFKYLLLNFLDIDCETFEFAVYGGNIEIIKIVEQKKLSYAKDCKTINNSILKHRNDLFDWIFEKNSKNDMKYIQSLAYLSAINGNVHSLAEIIFKGYNISNDIESIIKATTRNGFYMLTKFILQIYNQKNENMSRNKNFNYMNAVYYGNLAIFRLFFDQFSEYSIEESFCYSTEKGYINIINFLFDSLKNNVFKLSKDSVSSILCSSSKNKSVNMLNYLLENFKQANIDISLSIYKNLLNSACINNNFEFIKAVTNIIINIDIEEDFSDAFCVSASNGLNTQCQYFIDKKVRIDYTKVAKKNDDLGQLSEQIFSEIFKNINPKMKKLFINSVKGAIKFKNKELIEYLFKEGVEYDEALIQAVETRDLEIVEIVLKYFQKPYLINLLIENKTALSIAVHSNELQIVKRLLLVPGIDPSLFSIYYKEIKYPLLSAIDKNNLDILNAILDFYGDDIQYQKGQLDLAIALIFKIYCLSYSKSKVMPIINRILDIKYIDPNLYFSNLENIYIHFDESDEKEEYKRYNISSDDDFEYDYHDDFDDDLYKRSYFNIKSTKKDIDDNHNTILLAACILNDVNMVKKLLSHANINVNQYSFKNANTPLMIAVMKENLEIVKLLVEFPKTNINQRNNNGETALLIAAKLNLRDIVEVLIKCDRFDPEESRFEYAFAVSKWKIMRLLILSKFFNINNISISLLSTAVQNRDIEIVDIIISSSIFNRILSENSITNEIIFAINNHSFEIFLKLIKLIGNDVNICDSKNNSLLIHAARCLNEQVIDYILNNEQFDPNKKDILNAFVESYSSKNAAEILKNQFLSEVYILEKQIKKQKNKIQVLKTRIVKQKQQLTDIEESVNLKTNEFAAITQQKIFAEKCLQQKTEVKNIEQQKKAEDAFKQIIKNENNIQQQIEFEKKEIEKIKLQINKLQINLQKEQQILEQNTNEKEQFTMNSCWNEKSCYYFCKIKKAKYPKINMISIMNKLYEYDKSHEHLIDFSQLLPNGETFFSSFTCDFQGIEKVSNFLLSHGVDPNAQSINKVYPLERAILIDSYQLVLSLIETNKIDYSVKIRRKSKEEEESNDCFNTYLHLAACSSNASIIDLFLRKNFIDINTVNDLGNTPLMESCSYKTDWHFKEFFKYDNLNYLHRNNDGKDAIDLLIITRKNNSFSFNREFSENNDQIIDKNEYLQKLIEISEKGYF